MKTELLKRSASHRAQLEKEVELLSERTQSVLTNALIIGGTLASAYLVARLLTGSSKKSKGATLELVPEKKRRIIDVEPEPPGVMSQIGSAIASQAAIFLLGLAKEKIADYLQTPAAKTETTTTTNEPA